jgi:hypothetical protein
MLPDFTIVKFPRILQFSQKLQEKFLYRILIFSSSNWLAENSIQETTVFLWRKFDSQLHNNTRQTCTAHHLADQWKKGTSIIHPLNYR